MAIKTGYICPNGHRKTYASLTKTGDALQVNLRCSVCKSSVGANVDLLTDDNWTFESKKHTD